MDFGAIMVERGPARSAVRVLFRSSSDDQEVGGENVDKEVLKGEGGGVVENLQHQQQVVQQEEHQSSGQLQQIPLGQLEQNQPQSQLPDQHQAPETTAISCETNNNNINNTSNTRSNNLNKNKTNNNNQTSTCDSNCVINLDDSTCCAAKQVVAGSPATDRVSLPALQQQLSDPPSDEVLPSPPPVQPQPTTQSPIVSPIVEANRRFIEKQIEAIQEADSRRWNFDFRNYRPLQQVGHRYIHSNTELPPPIRNCHPVTSNPQVVDRSSSSCSSNNNTTTGCNKHDNIDQ